ncbi:MAG: ABC transporter ATP-binding protein [Caldilineaceae bacterium]
MTTVQLCRLDKSYGATAAVTDLNLTVASGEMVALLGPSGCGKTTTMRMVAGLLAPSSGDILFDGRSVLRMPAERRDAVMVFQKHLLFPHMSVAENVGFGLKMRGVGRAEQDRLVDAMLARVQLSGFGSRKSHQLSGGQQQRVALARALVVNPKVLLLDEPLSNLDANLRLEMRKLIRSLQQEMGITAIFVTHDQEEAVMLADRVALMMEGRLLQYGEPRSFYDRPSTPAVARFFRSENFLPGKKRGEYVDTACGTICAPLAASVADGDVLLTVRPEHVAITSHGASNCVPAVVTAVTYMGTHTSVECSVGGHAWKVSVPPDQPAAVGESVYLQLPPSRVWLVSGAAHWEIPRCPGRPGD